MEAWNHGSVDELSAASISVWEMLRGTAGLACGVPLGCQKLDIYLEVHSLT